jgi:hypothetical protein
LFLRQFIEDEDSVPNLTGALVRRAALRRVGGFEEQFKTLHEDVVFYAKLALVESVFVTREGWFLYRQHEDSCCRTAAAADTWADGRIRFLKWLDELLRETPGADAMVRRSVARQLEPVTNPRRHRARTLLWRAINGGAFRIRRVARVSR